MQEVYEMVVVSEVQLALDMMLPELKKMLRSFPN